MSIGDKTDIFESTAKEGMDEAMTGMMACVTCDKFLGFVAWSIEIPPSSATDDGEIRIRFACEDCGPLV